MSITKMSVKWPLAYSGVVLFTSADGPWHTVEWLSLPLPINATSEHLHNFDVLQVFSNKTDCPNLTEILLKMLLHTNNNHW
jgi:hypothetical protein